jgi:hypothetical protein
VYSLVKLYIAQTSLSEHKTSKLPKTFLLVVIHNNLPGSVDHLMMNTINLGGPFGSAGWGTGEESPELQGYLFYHRNILVVFQTQTTGGLPFKFYSYFYC